MNVQTLMIKMKQRLNKLDSLDYDNVECWQFVEVFNKAQVEWCRRQLAGTNVLKQGDEQSSRRVDDLQALMTTAPLNLNVLPIYSETLSMPVDYFSFKRLELFATKECCKEPRLMAVYETEEGNVSNDLLDKFKEPSFEWAETFMTFIGNKIRIYTNQAFDIYSANLIYYKQPVKIQVSGCMNPYTGTVSTADVDPGLKDDIVEVIIDDAVAILAGDIESLNQKGREESAAEQNN